MPVDKINTTPGVIKSTITREEINKTAQGWLEARRERNRREAHYLFGAEKKYKQPYSPKSVSMGSPVSDQSPVSDYYRGR